jgi:peptidoglycan/xylan/chitin deacetylase (PgdA/CDA1 family)
VIEVKFFCDENITTGIVHMMQSLGFDVRSSKSTRLFGLSNGDLIDYLNLNHCTILTFDKDFLEFGTDLKFGGIVIDIHPTNDRNVIPVLRQFLENLLTDKREFTRVEVVTLK